MTVEPTYMDECPGCGVPFVGMTVAEYLETHAETCPLTPSGFEPASSFAGGPSRFHSGDGPDEQPLDPDLDVDPEAGAPRTFERRWDPIRGSHWVEKEDDD